MGERAVRSHGWATGEGLVQDGRGGGTERLRKRGEALHKGGTQRGQ